MNTKTLLADPHLLRIEKMVVENSSLIILVRSVQKQVCCPLCQQVSNKRHSRYERRLADLPWQGIAVNLRLSLRRFFCSNDVCKRRIFAERLPKVATDFARRTLRLNETLTALAFAVGGEAGRRLAEKLGLATSADTLIRRIRQTAAHTKETPCVLGIDDFAFRKRHCYGTILIDLESRQPVDLLPDRESQTVSNWLKAHPGVETVSRDRSQLYAEGVRLGAPRAEQVADRWHLLKNAVDVFKEFLQQRQSDFHQARQAIVKPNIETTADEQIYTGDRRTRAKGETRQKRIKLYNQVQQFVKEGCSRGEISRRLGISKPYLRRLAKSDVFPERAPFPPLPTSLDRYADYLKRRWAEGCQTASQLWRELKEQSFRGPVGAVIRYVRLRMRDPEQIKVDYRRRQKSPNNRFVMPSAKRTAWLFLKKEDERTKEELVFLDKLLDTSPEIMRAVELTRQFLTIVKNRDADLLDAWLSEAEGVGTKWRNFVKGLRQDYSAVRAALTSKWSNGQTEGQVNRLKFLKRQMYGRAKFDLLRARVLYRG